MIKTTGYLVSIDEDLWGPKSFETESEARNYYIKVINAPSLFGPGFKRKGKIFKRTSIHEDIT